MSKKNRATGRERPRPEGITAISVAGFKSIRDEQRIEIRPLTILAGANSSGKSSIIQPLLLMKQTLEAPYDPGALRLDGPNVQLTSAEQALSKIGAETPRKEFSVGLEAGEEVKLRVSFDTGPEGRFDVRSVGWHWRQEPFLELSRGMGPEAIEKSLPRDLKSIVSLLRATGRGAKLSVVRRRCLLSVAVERSEPEALVTFELGTLSPPSFFLSLNELPYYPRESIDARIAKVVHVPGLRGNPERTYQTSAVGENFPGRFNDYVASVISHWQETQSEEKLKALGESLEDLGLTWKVEARQVDATRVELRVGRLLHRQRGGARDLVSIADVGFGLSQTLPVVVALLVADRGHIVYLEQPEIHLHPRAQHQMARLLADAARRGVRVVAETHSSLILRGVQTLVAKGELSSELVELHWFKRNEEGATEVHSTDLDEQGRFGEDWPEDFDEVALQSEGQYLDAVESLHR